MSAAAVPEIVARPREVNVRVVAAIVVTTLLWASAFVAIRSARTHYGAGAIALGRLVAAAAALSVMMWLRRPALPARRDWLPIAACGVLWLGVYNVALSQASGSWTRALRRWRSTWRRS